MPEQKHTSESVTEGHPDKVCDYIADSILDACIGQDKESRVARDATTTNYGHFGRSGLPWEDKSR